MQPISKASGHELLELLAQFVPDFGNEPEDVVVKIKALFDNQLPRISCPRFSAGLSSSDRGGNGRSAMFAGRVRFLVQAPQFRYIPIIPIG
jgi:hypothetical protein